MYVRESIDIIPCRSADEGKGLHCQRTYIAIQREKKSTLSEQATRGVEDQNHLVICSDEFGWYVHEQVINTYSLTGGPHVSGSDRSAISI